MAHTTDTTEMLDQRINFLVSDRLRKQIKRWRHQNEIDTEGEALRLLLERALQADQHAA